MLQFGCPYSKNPDDHRAGTGGPEPKSKFKNLVNGKTETRDRGGNIADECNEDMSNNIGTLAMANTGRPNSGGSQFFINVKHNSYLDCFNKKTKSNHPVFGKVTSGMDVVNKIENVKTNKSDRPLEPVVMNKVTVSEIPNVDENAMVYESEPAPEAENSNMSVYLVILLIVGALYAAYHYFTKQISRRTYSPVPTSLP